MICSAAREKIFFHRAQNGGGGMLKYSLKNVGTDPRTVRRMQCRDCSPNNLKKLSFPNGLVGNPVRQMQCGDCSLISLQ